MVRQIFVVGKHVTNPRRTHNKTMVGEYTSKLFRTKMTSPRDLKLDVSEKLIDDDGVDMSLKEWTDILNKFNK